MKMTCPHCRSSKKMSWQSDCSFEELGYEGKGVVSFWECMNCGTSMEICIPEENPYEEKKGGKKHD